MRKIALYALLSFFVTAIFGSTLIAAEMGQEKKMEGKSEEQMEQKAEEKAPPKPKTFVEERVAAAGDAAIDFALFDLTGETLITLEDIKKSSGKLLAVVFLNSTCVSCRNEAELLANMKKKYGDDLTLLAVITDMNPAIFEKTASEAMKNAFQVVHDPTFAMPPAYGFNFTPGLVLVKDGKVVETKGGFIPGKDDMAVVKLVKGNM